MKLLAALGAVLLGACGPAPAGRTEPARCSPSVPADAQHPLAGRTLSLAGEYDLIQVQTQPGQAERNERLHLVPVDSAARAAAIGRPAPDLIGWLEGRPQPGDPRSRAHSRDLQNPGVVLAGDHMRLGDVAAVDGYVEDLWITAVSPQGFWGWWKAHTGFEIGVDSETGRVLPDPAGYFCALRRGSGQ